MRAAFVVAFACASSLAGAEPLDKGVVPKGSGWQCFEWHAPDHAAQSLGVCVRTVKECETLRDDKKKSSPSQVLTACAKQPNASVFTFHNRMKDNWQYMATPQTRQCEAFRGFIARDADNDHVSDCAPIGEL